jgi:anti-sigma factor ChrR (cupin superfamily)
MKYHTSRAEIEGEAALYALGALPQDEARAFETHLAGGCELCNANLEAFQTVVGKLVFGALEEHPPPRARARLFAELAEEMAVNRPDTGPPPGPFGQSLTVRLDAGEWKEISGGAFVKRLFVDKTKNTVTSLYKLLPGAHLPAHRHTGIEECIVLEGDYHVNDEVLGPGDYHCALPGSIDLTLYTVGGTMFLIVAPEKCELL